MRIKGHTRLSSSLNHRELSAKTLKDLEPGLVTTGRMCRPFYMLVLVFVRYKRFGVREGYFKLEPKPIPLRGGHVLSLVDVVCLNGF